MVVILPAKVWSTTRVTELLQRLIAYKLDLLILVDRSHHLL